MVETVKELDEAPAGMVRLAGTVAAGLLLDKLTNMPPTGAGAAKLTVPFALAPLATDAGERERPERLPCPAVAALIARLAVRLFVEDAVIVTAVLDPTAVVATAKLPVEEPAGMTRLAGTVAAGLLLDKVTRIPPAGAGEPRLTVPVELAPLATVEGDSETPESVPWPAVAALMVKEADTLFAEVAVMLSVVAVLTAVVETAKVPDEAPAAMTSVPGTVAAALLLASVTRMPPVGAGAASVTVAVEAPPLATVAGAREIPERAPCPAVAALIVSAALRLFVELAVIVTEAVAPTAVVATVKVPLEAPAGMSKLPGSVAAGLSLARVTRIPPAGAGDPRLTVPAALPPLATVAGNSEIPEIVPCPAVAALIVREALAAFAEFAVMTTVVVEATGVVVTGKLPVDAPAGITMLAGVVAALWLLPSVTRTPPAGAGDAKVTVPVADPPLATVTGARDRPEITPCPAVAAWMVRLAVCAFAEAAVMVASVSDPTAVVDTVKVPLEEPVGITILAGRVAEGLLLDRLTNTPAPVAGVAKLTVPVEEAPLATAVGERVIPARFAVPGPEGWIVKLADTLFEELAAIDTVIAEETAVVAIGKVPDRAPAGITMLGARVAAVALEERLTSTPPLPAGEASVTVPVAALPPARVAGEIEIPARLPKEGVTLPG